MANTWRERGETTGIPPLAAVVAGEARKRHLCGIVQTPFHRCKRQVLLQKVEAAKLTGWIYITITRT